MRSDPNSLSSSTYLLRSQTLGSLASPPPTTPNATRHRCATFALSYHPRPYATTVKDLRPCSITGLPTVSVAGQLNHRRPSIPICSPATLRLSPARATLALLSWPPQTACRQPNHSGTPLFHLCAANSSAALRDPDLRRLPRLTSSPRPVKPPVLQPLNLSKIGTSPTVLSLVHPENCRCPSSANPLPKSACPPRPTSTVRA